MAVQALRDENRRMRDELDGRYQFDNIIGRSAAMRDIFQTVEASGADPGYRSACRRKRRWERHDCACHPSSFAASASCLRKDQLHRFAREPDGERIVRL